MTPGHWTKMTMMDIVAEAESPRVPPVRIETVLEELCRRYDALSGIIVDIDQYTPQADPGTGLLGWAVSRVKEGMEDGEQGPDNDL